MSKYLKRVYPSLPAKRGDGVYESGRVAHRLDGRPSLVDFLPRNGVTKLHERRDPYVRVLPEINIGTTGKKR